jgi:hypothetical protein
LPWGNGWLGFCKYPFALRQQTSEFFQYPICLRGKGCQSFANTHLCCTINSWG